MSLANSHDYIQEAHEYDVDDDSAGAFDTVHEFKDGDNLNTHPFFKSEYVPPEELRPLMMERCRRGSNETPSPRPPSSPPTPVVTSVSKGKKVPSSRTSSTMKRAAAAGLVSGDSDSSALTQESGDEGVATVPTPPSVATDTEEGNAAEGGGAVDVEEDDIDMPDASPGLYLDSRVLRLLSRLIRALLFCSISPFDGFKRDSDS
jgi:MRG-binding protein